MYKHLEKPEILSILGFPDDYSVDALLVVGTHPKGKEYPHIYEALKQLGCEFKEEEPIQDTFFGDIKSFVVNGKRVWFDVVYGTAYLSEIVHVASMLGSKSNILLGTCGGLALEQNTGDTVIPKSSFGNESSTRMYQRDNTTFLYNSSPELSKQIKEALSERKVVIEGGLVTVQAMLAETEEDVKEWSAKGYVGVDMESATLFAVSNHFNVPAAALLYVADNLIKNELMDNPAYKALKAQRTAIRQENYNTVLKILCA